MCLLANKIIDGKGGSALLSDEQNEWVNATKYLSHHKPILSPVKPKDYLIRKLCYVVVTHKYFGLFIGATILLNIIFLASTYQFAPKSFVNALEVGNIVFTVIFALEALMKNVAFGPKMYFADPWNRLDFTIVLLVVIGYFLNLGALAGIFRVLRVARLVSLVRCGRCLFVFSLSCARNT